VVVIQWRIMDSCGLKLVHSGLGFPKLKYCDFLYPLTNSTYVH
jgi:hypothetical protein